MHRRAAPPPPALSLSSSPSRFRGLYPRNASAELGEGLFRNPPAEYRGTPFWSWNNKLDLPQLLRQIEVFRAMGFGGVHIHSRTGLDTEYLGDEWMRAVVACTERAAELSMLSWLYDEDRWPSGFAGGIVTREERFRSKRLVWTRTPRADEKPLARFEVRLKDGRLEKYRRLKDGAKGREPVWHAYLESPPADAWFNGQTDVDRFDRLAIERFIEVTHEKYSAAVGTYFGTVVPAIFTDEPQMPKKQVMARATDERDVILPFTTDFPESFRAAYGRDLLDHLPELFWNLPDDAPSLARWRYHDHTAERFADAFGDTIGRWCDAHGIALIGHMLGEVNLFGQTRGVGEVMRAMRSFHIPGIDILQDKIELTTAKQAQSLARQLKRDGVVSELYGVTNWDFDFIGHKAQGDWQAAMGVTVRVPHLSWVSMAGEAKRDYPASIGYQSPWHREYPLIENHFARINAVMSRGRAIVRVGVIHPIESFWLSWGSMDLNQSAMEEREERFKNITDWLCFGLVDFDYVSEALLPRQKGLKYDAIIVPGLRTIRATTLKWLEQLANAGASVIFAGEAPSLVEVKPSKAVARLAKRCTSVPFAKRPILDALAPFRDITVTHADATPADSMLYQLRADGKQRHFFLCNTDRERGRWNTSVRIRGRWDVTMRDTMTGDTRPMHARIEGGDTIVPWTFQPHDHLLLTLKPGGKRNVAAPTPPKWSEVGRLHGPVPVTLSEPNVLLLDQASWRLDDGEWQEREEILRLDNLVRARLNLSSRGGRMPQPWTDRETAPQLAQLELKFIIRSDVDVKAPQLALENPQNVEIHVDGKLVAREITGWWVDEAIKTVALPALAAGEHELTLTMPFTRKTDVEACYLLGDFGAVVSGRDARIVAPVRKLSFGDWTDQGLPFYGGNVTYHCTLTGDGSGEMQIECGKFKNPLLSLDLDRRPAGKIAFAPFQLNLGVLAPGERRLDITAFGNRVNTFGPVHNANEKITWIGPGAWRHSGANFSYEYQLKRTGVLAAPIVRVAAR
jgi:hypothetical protein